MQANVLDLYYQDNMNDRQHSIDFAGLVDNGVMAIFHKASQGLHFRDPLYATRRKKAFQAGLLWGAYHFLDNGDAEQQAENFLASCGFDDPTLPMPMVFADYEQNGGNTAVLHQLQTFITRVNAAAPGMNCGVYSSNLIRETLRPAEGGHVHPDMIGAADFFKRCPLWLAEYGPHENIPWPWESAMLWQFNDRGKFSQIVGPVDVNLFAGSREKLAAFWPNNGG